jgi:DNA-binding response OmpR family regulator
VVKESRAFDTRIAVLDDDIRFIRMVERALAGAGIGVQPVTTPAAAEAVDVIASLDCAAALVDVYMYGEAAGFDIVHGLRGNEATRRLPLLLTTAARREVARHAAFLERHDCEVLLKPFDAAELVRAVQGLVAPVRAAVSAAEPRAVAPTNAWA